MARKIQVTFSQSLEIMTVYDRKIENKQINKQTHKRSNYPKRTSIKFFLYLSPIFGLKA